MSSVSSALRWLQMHYFELIAVITGLLYVICTIRQHILLWFFGIVSSGLYIWIFYKSGIFAYAVLYGYYVVMGIYGWYNWSRKLTDPEKPAISLTVHHAPRIYLWTCLLMTGLLVVPIYYILRKFTSSDMALVDALLTSGGMVATWMLTQKLIEQWLFWIVIDFLSLCVMIYKHLYPSALLFLVYTLLAVKGYLEWRKELRLRSAG
jgi:nicotinamide mononucleotide transporter